MKITTEQLANLAAQLQPKPGREREAIRRAATLWQEAEREIEQAASRAEYLQAITASIYTDSPADWQTRLAAYPGDPVDVKKHLESCVPAPTVHRQLFKDAGMKIETRAKLFVGLLKYAQAHGMTPPPGRNWPGWPRVNLLPPDANENQAWVDSVNAGEEDRAAHVLNEMRRDLGAESLPLCVVRWAVEVRGKQIAAGRSRQIPASTRHRKRRE